MAIDYTKYGILGFWAAIGTGFILKFISQIVSTIPGITLNLQAVTAETTGLGGIIGTGLNTYAKKLFGMVSIVSLPEWIYIGIGGALFVMLGAWVVDNVKQLQFAKTKTGKLATVLVVAGIASGWILSTSIGIPPLTGIIVMAVDAFVLSYILIAVNDAAKLKLIP